MEQLPFSNDFHSLLSKASPFIHSKKMLELPSKASNPPRSLSHSHSHSLSTTDLKASVPLMAEPEAKPEPKEVEENPDPPLIYKTWILKVSIHCEACKRKVKRVLKDVEGVYETDIDLKHQKVVVKGNVESETLIKKLLKTGKHAELWPEKVKSKGKSKKKEKNSDSESSDESSGHEDEKEKVKFEVQDPTKNGDPAGKIIDGGGDSQAKQPGPAPAGDGQTSGGGGKKKKKKKKKKSGGGGSGGGGNASGEAPGDPPANGVAPAGPAPGHPEPGPQPAPGPLPIIANESPPRHFVTQYAPHYIPHPVYSVRYSTAYATCSQPQRESYYATPQQYSYAYVHPVRPQLDSPPSDFEPYSPHPSDSLEIFSDENPNGCSIV